MTSNTNMPSDDSTPTSGDGIDVAHLSALARLALNAEATSEVASDLQSIVTLIDAMRTVDTEGVEPLSHPFDGTARLRADEVTEHPDPEHFQRNAPATSDQYYLVPRVVE
jgi:aspartyl-tRNA(Asn)/glutamyl-tRNA(Gln) amidotransferase subunit C